MTAPGVTSSGKRALYAAVVTSGLVLVSWFGAPLGPVMLGTAIAAAILLLRTKASTRSR